MWSLPAGRAGLSQNPPLEPSTERGSSSPSTHQETMEEELFPMYPPLAVAGNFPLAEMRENKEYTPLGRSLGATKASLSVGTEPMDALEEEPPAPGQQESCGDGEAFTS